ncbi:MAG: 6-phosphogluconolactonase [Chloroflexi bacterium]|nr:6-phosphogluconolactonase [Chloroflexota bacterium]
MAADPELVVVDGPAEAASAAADRIAAVLADAAARRGRADWATTGGSSVVGIYRRLVAEPLRDAVPWPSVHVWWGDDRYVPRDHPLSNVKPLDDILLGIGLTEEGGAGGRGPGVPLAVEHLHPFRTTEAIGGSRGAAWCAAGLANELADAHLPAAGPWPAFDLLLLGVGADGHLLSVFPGSPALGAGELALAIPAPGHIEPHVERVTLNPAVVGAAGHVLVIATGASKAPILGQVFGETRDPARWPAQLARRAGATWILDVAAAADVPH